MLLFPEASALTHPILNSLEVGMVTSIPLLRGKWRPRGVSNLPKAVELGSDAVTVCRQPVGLSL